MRAPRRAAEAAPGSIESGIELVAEAAVSVDAEAESATDAEALNASASRRNASQCGRSASRQATRPALASSTWPVAVRSPARSALRRRNASGSMPQATDSSSIRVSCATAACGTPKPRKAPAGGECVKIARASARTFGTR